MLRVLFRLAFGCALLVALAGGWLLWRSPDPFYDASEMLAYRRYHRFDQLITDAARRQSVDPLLIKAVIWRESRFQPEKEGNAGERGLMQITSAAAAEWAKSERGGALLPQDLFDPRTNIEAGTWLLARALRRWQAQSVDNPVPFALAEYNAGRSRVQRWVAAAGDRDRDPAKPGNQISGGDLEERIGFPGTRQYVQDVQGRAEFYRKRGRL
ncbi:MAG: lytic transglycosylase domain-containing protein [Verrucomicrobia bacterium]|nr:lytic transglycosylase domain-containing protein [Verrucomicrobiota bacterium]MBV9658650.1 lytic transglycosylase domain-containing protein [Verrucomicrobiota bacterium]